MDIKDVIIRVQNRNHFYNHLISYIDRSKT